jgi:hypothetical protein
LLVDLANGTSAAFHEALLLAKQAFSELQSVRCDLDIHREEKHQPGTSAELSLKHQSQSR